MWLDSVEMTEKVLHDDCVLDSNCLEILRLFSGFLLDQCWLTQQLLNIISLSLHLKLSRDDCILCANFPGKFLFVSDLMSLLVRFM